MAVVRTYSWRSRRLNERVPHLMLKAIAQNPDTLEGVTREEIDAARRPDEARRVQSGPIAIRTAPARNVAYVAVTWNRFR